MIKREAENTLKTLANQFKAVALVGPRQSGKSTLAKTVFPDKPYVSLENPELKDRASLDPQGFLHQFREGAIIDEAQRVPELFNYLQQVLDESNERGKYILTGSNNFLMLEKITQSLAGRLGYLDLMPFNLPELFAIQDYPKNIETVLFRGGYPSVTYEKIDPKFWFPAYVRTYVERDVRQIRNVTDLATFQRFVFLCAARIGQQLNLSNLAIECGVDHKTIQSWISILQASYILYLLPPYFKNYSKRVIKSPKLYFYDTGLACYLLGLESEINLAHHPMRGALFENFVINEFLKKRFNIGQRSNLYYWRDTTGHEIDLLLETLPAPVAIEIKSGMTVNNDFFKGLLFWQKLNPISNKKIIYGGESSYTRKDEIEIVAWKDLVSLTI